MAVDNVWTLDMTVYSFSRTGCWTNKNFKIEEMFKQQQQFQMFKVLPTVKNSEVNMIFPTWPIVELPNLCFSNT